MTKVLIVEDELHNTRLLSGMINKLRPDWEIIGAFESIKSTVNWLRTNEEPDLYFMDIQLTDGLCFSIFDQIDLHNQVIFTTAYNNFAIQAFKVNSIDYLLKPLKEQKLLMAIEKFENLNAQNKQSKNHVSYNDVIEAIKNNEVKYRKRFLVTGATSLYKVDVDEIAYVYTEERTTFAVDFNKKEHLINLTLEKLEEQLNPENFYRANRSTIINSESVKKIENYFGGKLSVRLVEPLNKQVLVSRLKASEIKAWLDR